MPITHGYATIHVGEKSFITNGIIANVSENGACIYTIRKIDSGVPVKIFNKAFGSAPREANVVWSREVTDGLYMLGLALS